MVLLHVHVYIDVESPLAKVVYCHGNWQNNNQSNCLDCLARAEGRNTAPSGLN